MSIPFVHECKASCCVYMHAMIHVCPLSRKHNVARLPKAVDIAAPEQEQNGHHQNLQQTKRLSGQGYHVCSWPKRRLLTEVSRVSLTHRILAPPCMIATGLVAYIPPVTLSACMTIHAVYVLPFCSNMPIHAVYVLPFCSNMPM